MAWKHTATFTTTDDNGSKYTVRRFDESIDASHLQAQATISGRKRFELSDGTPVNRTSPGVLEIVRRGGNLRITSDDPAAQ